MRCRCGCCEGSHVVRAYNGGCAAGTLREGRVGRCKLQDTGKMCIRDRPYTMTPEQAIRATQIIKPHILYPYHYGDTDINKVKEGLKNEKTTEVRIRALQ